jgi:hypothetical protein
MGAPLPAMGPALLAVGAELLTLCWATDSRTYQGPASGDPGRCHTPVGSDGIGLCSRHLAKYVRECA